MRESDDVEIQRVRGWETEDLTESLFHGTEKHANRIRKVQPGSISVDPSIEP